MASWLSELFGGTPAGVQQVSNYNPQQNDILNQLLSMGMGGLQNPTKGFEPIENQARNSFASDTIPGLAERFTAVGGGGTSLGSSGFQGALGAAGSGLESSLAGLKAQYGQGQQQHFSNLLNMGLQPRNTMVPNQPTQGLAGSLLPILGQLGMGAAAGGLTGGWAGIMPALAAVLQLMAHGGKDQNQNQNTNQNQNNPNATMRP
jgi:hypothetical protein